MIGYEVIYLENGKEDVTFFSALEGSSEEIDIIKFTFNFAHPNCDIISINSCSLDDFYKKHPNYKY